MMKRKFLKVFFVCICYTVFFCSNTAFCIDWEQWRIPDDSSIPDVPAPVPPADPSYGVERPAPRQDREDTRKREAFKLNEKGNHAYSTGNWKEAVGYYEKALRKSPNDRVIRQNLTHAQNALAEEDTRKREEDLRKRKEDTRKREAFKLNKKKGDKAYRAGNWNEAIDYYEKALRKFPDDMLIRQNLTNAQNAIAKEDTQKEDAFELNKKGIQAYRAGNWNEAIDYYEKALRKFPDDMLIRQNLTNAQNALNAPANNQGKAIADLRKSVYWSLKSAKVAASGNNNKYEAARDLAGHPFDQESGGGNIQLPSVPDVPSPVSADPQVRLYQFLTNEANRTTSELKLINTNLKQAKEEKRKSEEKIDIQKTKIEELKQKKSESKKRDKQENVDGLSADAQVLQKEQEETDDLIAAALAVLAEAEEKNREASKNLASLNEQKKEQEENLSNLQQVFDAAEKDSEQAGEILKKLEEGK